MSKQMPQKFRLGRGLSSLINTAEEEPVAASAVATQVEDSTSNPGSRISEVPIDQVTANPHQPRRQFDETSLNELANSLRTTGMIQPVVARSIEGGRIELIAGERRWRAAKIAGLTTLPVILRKVEPIMQAQMALVENLQRQDLNPIERATAYKTLLNNLGLTHGELADRLGEDRSVIGHHVRLLELPPDVQKTIAEGRLSASHAKILVGIADPAEQSRLATLTISQGLNLKNLERLAALPIATQATPDVAKAPSAHLLDLEKSLSRQLGMKVQIKSAKKKGRGRLVLHFANLDQFDDLMAKLGLASE